MPLLDSYSAASLGVLPNSLDELTDRFLPNRRYNWLAIGTTNWQMFLLFIKDLSLGVSSRFLWSLFEKISNENAH